MNNSLYRDELLTHIKNPKNMGSIKSPSYEAKVINTSCGDEIVVQISIENDKLVDLKYEGDACAVAKASASMLSEQLIGKNISYLLNLTEKEILNNFISLTPARTPCALLILKALQNIKKEILNEKNK